MHIDRDVYGTLRPNADLAWDIGEDGRRWGTTFTQDLNITQDVYGTLRPSGEGLYTIGQPDRRWVSGHFGNTGGIQLNENGSIGLPGVGDVGTENMILTSKGNGQAVWDFIHFESQDQRVFIAHAAVQSGNTPLGGSLPAGHEPGQVFATTAWESGIQEAILSLHSTVDFRSLPARKDPKNYTCQVRVCLEKKKDGAQTFEYHDFATTMAQNPKIHEINIAGETAEITESQSKTAGCVACFTFVQDLDPTAEYRAVGGCNVGGGNDAGINLADGSVRVFFIR